MGRKQAAYTMFWTMKYKIINGYLDKVQAGQPCRQSSEDPAQNRGWFDVWMHRSSATPSSQGQPQCHAVLWTPVPCCCPCPGTAWHRAGRAQPLQQLLDVPWQTQELGPISPISAPADSCCALQDSQQGKLSSHCSAHPADNSHPSFKAGFALHSPDKLLLCFFFLIFLSAF